jgi:hypothetical protein
MGARCFLSLAASIAGNFITLLAALLRLLDQDGRATIKAARLV